MSRRIKYAAAALNYEDHFFDGLACNWLHYSQNPVESFVSEIFPELLIAIFVNWGLLVGLMSRCTRALKACDYPNRVRKSVDAPLPPFPNEFPLTQHKLGPYQPILDVNKVH